MPRRLAGRSSVGKSGGKSGSHQDWTVLELKKRAIGISGYSKLYKDKLINKLRNHSGALPLGSLACGSLAPHLGVCVVPAFFDSAYPPVFTPVASAPNGEIIGTHLTTTRQRGHFDNSTQFFTAKAPET